MRGQGKGQEQFTTNRHENSRKTPPHPCRGRCPHWNYSNQRADVDINPYRVRPVRPRTSSRT